MEAAGVLLQFPNIKNRTFFKDPLSLTPAEFKVQLEKKEGGGKRREKPAFMGGPFELPVSLMLGVMVGFRLQDSSEAEEKCFEICVSMEMCRVPQRWRGCASLT